MVSQPEPAPSSLSVRGTSSSSVVSRPSLSRTKRYNRSHAGGTSSYASQNEFPVFSQSGDVEILIRVGPAENRYLLHRHTLTRCSGFFEASTSSEWSRARPLLAGGNELARIGHDAAAALAMDGDSEPADGVGSDAITPRRRWRYELDPGSGDGDVPMLVQRDEPRPDDSRLPPPTSIFGPGSRSSTHPHYKGGGYAHSHSHSFSHSKRDFARSVMNLSVAPPPALSHADQDLLRDYDNLFRIFYNYPPALDGINVADAYVQCKSLLTLADQYDALAVVGPRVDHHLLQFQSRLWKQIAKYPISYLRLGYLARSKLIFQEALIHIVGQWPAGERSLRATMPDSVLDIIEDKVDELEETVSRVEGRLFRLNLTTARGERVTPNSSYLDWLATSLFRQWLADNTTPQPAEYYRHHNPQHNHSHSHNHNHNHHHHHHQHQHHSAPHHHRPGSRDSRPSSSSIAPPSPPPAPPLTSVGRAYRTLGTGSPSSFLGHDQCKRFLKLTPDLYSRDNLRRFERRMDELKAMARAVVRPLMSSGLELDLSGESRAAAAEGIEYLTCTEVGTGELPWMMDR